MSMLAEKRQRKSWILNPRSTAWTKDSNKFGQKILEKMGWTPGKGLGINEQGMVDILRVKYKNDFKGLGCDKKVEEWIKTQEDFNSLLEELGDGEEIKKVGEKSLEKTSKSMRSRVHYHKFARGKDLSRYSSEDLKSILGLNNDFKNTEELRVRDNEIINCGNYIKNDGITSTSDHIEGSEEQDELLINENDQRNWKRRKNKKPKVSALEMKANSFEISLQNTKENDGALVITKKRKKKQ